MDLYTLSSSFLAVDYVDEFVSAIWTERYSTHGDVQIVLPATNENIDKLVPGTFLALRGSREVMICETQVIENELLTVTGRTLISFLDERFMWYKNPDSSDAAIRIVDYTEDLVKPGTFLGNVVTKMAISPVTLGGLYVDADLDWVNEAIPGLTLGAIDASGTSKRMTLPIGPLYSGMADIALKEGVGMSLYLESADPIDGYSLKFTTYVGVDRTSDQVLVPLVRLSPDFDTIGELKEVRSISGYKNVVYVYYQGEITEHIDPNWVGEPEGFERRSMVRDAEGEPVGHAYTYSLFNLPSILYTGYTVDAGDVTAFREQTALDALANNNYIRAIDGQASPENDYAFGVDYNLGDILELEGVTGALSKARVTEYIRAQDKSGERAYPTISVIS